MYNPRSTSGKLVCTHTICPHHIYTVDNRSYMVWTTVVHTICYPQHISLKGVLHSIYPQHNLCHPRYIHMMSTPYYPQHICRPHHHHGVFLALQLDFLAGNGGRGHVGPGTRRIHHVFDFLLHLPPKLSHV